MRGKTIVVTGAGGALGEVVKQAAVSRGAGVAALYRGDAPDDGALAFSGVDLSDPEAAQRAMQAVYEQTGRLDVLLNIAGAFAFEKIFDGDTAVWDRMFTANLKTALNASRAALPFLLANGAGRIVNVGALGAVKAGSGMGAYAASKAAVARLTESLSDELKGRVNVNAVLPSTIDTPANRAAMPKADYARWVAPGDLAAVILFLASDEARAMTGALVPVSGGA